MVGNSETIHLAGWSPSPELPRTASDIYAAPHTHAPQLRAAASAPRIFVKQHSLGKVYNADTGFELSPDTVRAPDAAFVRKDRLDQGRGHYFFPGAPDLAVEVFSPSDPVPQLMRKVHQYLKAGSHTVWIVYPETKQVHVFESAGPDRILHPGDILEAATLLPGFSVPVASLFE